MLSSPFEIRRVDVPVFMRDDIREARDRAVSKQTTLFPFAKEALSESLSAASDNAGMCGGSVSTASATAQSV